MEAYYVQMGLNDNTVVLNSNRSPFDDTMCDLVLEFHPEVVSFHFGLPDRTPLARVRRTGAKIISSATSVDEAGWLEDQGCDAIVAQGYEAGGHRGMFLTQDVSTQVGTMALVPQVVDAVRVPVIAAGGSPMHAEYWRLLLLVRQQFRSARPTCIARRLRSVHSIAKQCKTRRTTRPQSPMYSRAVQHEGS